MTVMLRLSYPANSVGLNLLNLFISVGILLSDYLFNYFRLLLRK